MARKSQRSAWQRKRSGQDRAAETLRAAALQEQVDRLRASCNDEALTHLLRWVGSNGSAGERRLLAA